jgi:hypothetical protein
VATHLSAASASRGPKMIQSRNTHLSATVVAAVSGRTPRESPHVPPHPPSIMSGAASDSLASTVPGAAGGGAGRVRKYTTVAMTPTPIPGVTDPSPIMTWGAVGGTPMILNAKEVLLSLPLPMQLSSGGGGGSEMSYEPPRAKKRDLLAQALGSKGGVGGGATTLRAPRQSSSSGHGHVPGKTKLTPAALSLAQQLSARRATAAAGSSTPFGGLMRDGYQGRSGGRTSSSSSKHGGISRSSSSSSSSSSSVLSVGARARPSAPPVGTDRPRPPSSSVNTDNLLNI